MLGSGIQVVATLVAARVELATDPPPLPSCIVNRRLPVPADRLAVLATLAVASSEAFARDASTIVKFRFTDAAYRDDTRSSPANDSESVRGSDYTSCASRRSGWSGASGSAGEGDGQIRA